MSRYTQSMLSDHINLLRQIFGSSIVNKMLEESLKILGNEVRLVSFDQYEYTRDGTQRVNHKLYICHLCRYNEQRMIDLPEWVAGERKRGYKLRAIEQSDFGAMKHSLKHAMRIIKKELTT